MNTLAMLTQKDGRGRAKLRLRAYDSSKPSFTPNRYDPTGVPYKWKQTRPHSRPFLLMKVKAELILVIIDTATAHSGSVL